MEGKKVDAAVAGREILIAACDGEGITITDDVGVVENEPSGRKG